MHKATLLEGTIRLALIPAGPILIKAGETGGADPTHPDMEFVRTRRNGNDQVYIPGSSLKGVVRAQCERICRSLDGPERYDHALAHVRQQGEQFIPPLADNPVLSKPDYADYHRGGNDLTFASSIYFNDHEVADTAVVYRRSAFVTQLFGHTSLAGRVRFADAYADDDVRLEERNGVAIDRVYGSVAVGPFTYEVAVTGTFQTRIDFKNVTLAHLALLGLALRDITEGRVAIGFGKSRGLGRVTVDFQSLALRYPTCIRNAQGALCLLKQRDTAVAEAGQFAGVGALAKVAGGFDAYAFPATDVADLPGGVTYTDDKLMGVTLQAEGKDAIYDLWGACMPCWREVIGL